jgi:hypothetical protein
MSGVIAGGWGYVTSAYCVTALVLIAYSTSVLWRYRSERIRAERERHLRGERT